MTNMKQGGNASLSQRGWMPLLNLILTDLLDGYEKMVSAFVIEICKIRTTASALSSCAIDVYNL